MSNSQLDSHKFLRINHVTVEVHDIEKSLNFYTEILGLKEIYTPEEVRSKGVRWLDLTENQAIHLIEITNMMSPSSAHFAIEVENIEYWKKQLSDNHIEILAPKFNIYNATRFFINDPSGNRIEFLEWLS